MALDDQVCSGVSDQPRLAVSCISCEKVGQSCEFGVVCWTRA